MYDCDPPMRMLMSGGDSCPRSIMLIFNSTPKLTFQDSWTACNIRFRSTLPGLTWICASGTLAPVLYLDRDRYNLAFSGA